MPFKKPQGWYGPSNRNECLIICNITLTIILFIGFSPYNLSKYALLDFLLFKHIAIGKKSEAHSMKCQIIIRW